MTKDTNPEKGKENSLTKMRRGCGLACLFGLQQLRVSVLRQRREENLERNHYHGWDPQIRVSCGLSGMEPQRLYSSASFCSCDLSRRKQRIEASWAKISTDAFLFGKEASGWRFRSHKLNTHASKEAFLKPCSP